MGASSSTIECFHGYNDSLNPMCQPPGWINEPGPSTVPQLSQNIKQIYKECQHLSKTLAWKLLRWCSFEQDIRESDELQRIKFLKFNFKYIHNFLSENEIWLVLEKKHNKNENAVVLTLDRTIPGQVNFCKFDNEAMMIKSYQVNANWDEQQALVDLARSVIGSDTVYVVGK